MERKTRKKSDLLTTLAVFTVSIFIICIVIFGVTYILNSIRIEKRTEQQSEQDIKKNNTVILYNINDNKGINQYGYIVTSNNSSSILLQGITLRDNQEQVEAVLFENLSKLYNTLQNDNFKDKVSKIDIIDIENIKIYVNLENKIINIGDFEDLSIKFRYVKSIMEQEKGKQGTIFVNDINKVYFRQDV